MRQAVTLAPRIMQLMEVEPPKPGPGEAIVEVAIVGLCGSDYHLFNGEHPYARYPQTQGHEFTAHILELPRDYTGDLRQGDAVVVEPVRPCGECFACRRGNYNCCSRLEVMGAHIPGALADRVAVPVWAMHPIGDLPIDIATLVEPVSIGLQAVTRGGVAAGDAVVVIGGGPIGLAAVLAAGERGARVLAVDRIPARLEAARRMGATATLDTTTQDVLSAIDEVTGGDGAAVVIDATGVPSLIRLAVEVVANSGTVVVVGISDGSVELPVIDFTRKELNLRGSRNNMGLFPEAIALVARHREVLRSWITNRIDPVDVPETIAYAIAHPEKVEKVLVHFNEKA